MEIEIGEIVLEDEIEIGGIEIDVQKVYPELEDLEITPRAFEQKFNHPNSYGYDEITVNPIDIKLQSKEVNPTKEKQTVISDSQYDGLREVTVNPIPNEYILPMGEIDIIENGTFDITNYETANVKVPKHWTESDIKDVNFYNPLGELLYSYTTQEALALEEMPEVPPFEEMTTTGWNYSYEEMIYQVEQMGVADIGCQYYWADETTRLYLNIDNPSYLKPYLSMRINGTITVDWGDGSETDTITAYNNITSSPTVFSHEYATTGKYVIKIHYDTPQTVVALGEYTPSNRLLWDGVDVENFAYRDYLYRIDIFGFENTSLKFTQNLSDLRNLKYIFSRLSVSVNCCWSLKALIQYNPDNWNITAPMMKYCSDVSVLSISSLARNIGTNNYYTSNANLKRLILPQRLLYNVTARYYNGISTYNHTLKEAYLPDNYEKISGFFNTCLALKKVVFGDVTNIGSGTFQSCANLQTFDFLKCTNVPAMANVNCFSISASYALTPTDRKILVPYDLYSAWIEETNWVSFIDIIYAAGKFSAGETLPTGYTWYKDEKHTIPVSSATAPNTGIYYAEVS